MWKEYRKRAELAECISSAKKRNRKRERERHREKRTKHFAGVFVPLFFFAFFSFYFCVEITNFLFALQQCVYVCVW